MDDIHFFKIETNHIKPRKGSVLIAEPFLRDAVFESSIVLLTEHNEEGTIGFVLNKPLNTSMQEIIQDFPEGNFSVSLGGPVASNSLHYIHTLGERIPGSIHVYDKVYWGGDFDALKKLIQAGKIKEHEVRFFIGYSGWEPRQLERELSENSWLVTYIDTDKIMRHSDKKLWYNVLSKLGPRYKMWINAPADPSLN